MKKKNVNTCDSLYRMLNYKKAERQISRLRVHIFLLRSDKRTCINVPANSICNKCYRGFIMLIGRRGSRDADLRRYATCTWVALSFR